MLVIDEAAQALEGEALIPLDTMPVHNVKSQVMQFGIYREVYLKSGLSKECVSGYATYVQKMQVHHAAVFESRHSPVFTMLIRTIDTLWRCTTFAGQKAACSLVTLNSCLL